MACLLALVLAATVLTVPTGNKLANAARTSPAEAFWRTALPGAAMPEAIRQLLHTRAESTVLNDVIKLNDDGDDPPPMSFKYDDYRAQKASPRNNAAVPTPEALKHVAGAHQNAATDADAAVFFLEDEVRVGASLPFRSVQRASAVTDAPAAAAAKDLQAPLRLLTVRAVRAAAEGSSFVVCRRRVVRGPFEDEAVAYGCRATTSGPARAYALDVAGGGHGDGEDAVVVMSAAVVCHADTSRWDPEHVAFRLLGVKPGGAAVCYAVPDAHVLAAGGDESPGAP